MGFEFVKKLPTPAEIKEQYPISAEIAKAKAERDEEIKKVFTGESDKFLAIIGPCSRWHIIGTVTFHSFYRMVL